MKKSYCLIAILCILSISDLAFAACGTSQTQDAVISTYDSRCTCNNAQASCQCTSQNSAWITINFSLFNGFWTTYQTVNASYDAGATWTTWPSTIPPRNTATYSQPFLIPTSQTGTTTSNMIIKQFDANNPSSCWTRSFTITITYIAPTQNTCSDGTPYNSCSSSKPFYCNNGNLVSNCGVCGCSSGTCQSDGTCKTTQTCTDGTSYGSCSTNIPMYCSNGNLISKASICGCPAGQTTNGDICTTPNPSGCQYNNPPCSSNYQCVNNQCVPLTCSDGTHYGQCSSNKPKYCLNGNLVDKASTCGCPNLYIQSGESCIWPTCSDGTKYGECSTTLPKYCSGGTLTDKASMCGCPSNYEIKGESCVPKQCSDGTLNNQCSSTKPKYCVDGSLVDKASTCGCPSSDYDISGESCILKPGCQYNNPACGSDYECVNNQCVKRKCADGTPYGECASTKPEYCSGGNLVNNASACGCLSNYNVVDDNCVLKGVVRTIIQIAPRT